MSLDNLSAVGNGGDVDSKAPFVLTRCLIDDIETPVSAYLKLAKPGAHTFLFESVEGGAFKGRYSILTLDPDLIWRCFGQKAEIAEGPEIDTKAYRPEQLSTLESLRALIKDNALEIPEGLPPMASGLFGVFGYDLIRLTEPLGEPNPDPLSLPDAIITRPRIVCIFDNVNQEIRLCTPVRPAQGDSKAAAELRLDAVEEALRQPLKKNARPTPIVQPALTPDMTEAQFSEVVSRCKAYIEAGDIFQVVPSHRFEAEFKQDPFSFYRSLRRNNPAPYLFFLDFGDFQLAGSSPEILVRLRDGKLTIRPIAGTRPRGKNTARRQATRDRTS